jgi:hypothetical protein
LRLRDEKTCTTFNIELSTPKKEMRKIAIFYQKIGLFISAVIQRIRIFSIPDLGFRIRIKEFKYFNSKEWFLSTRKYDPGCSSLPIPDPGSRGQKGHRDP